jgi:hypothetical protein
MFVVDVENNSLNHEEKIKSVIAINKTKTDLARASKCFIFDYHTSFSLSINNFDPLTVV